MIEALKSDEIVNKVGGRFKLTALIQKRMLELMDGARPLVERGNMTDLEAVVQEILQDKIAIAHTARDLAAHAYLPATTARQYKRLRSSEASQTISGTLPVLVFGDPT